MCAWYLLVVLVHYCTNIKLLTLISCSFSCPLLLGASSSASFSSCGLLLLCCCLELSPNLSRISSAPSCLCACIETPGICQQDQPRSPARGSQETESTKPRCRPDSVLLVSLLVSSDIPWGFTCSGVLNCLFPSKLEATIVSPAISEIATANGRFLKLAHSW